VKILVVDDDRSIRAALDRALRFEGYEVGLASNGAVALDAVRDDPPDLLVLDLSMPDVDGLDVCRRLRAAGDTTPILMLTARHTLGDRVVGLDAGADDYLVKPFALEELLARVRALLRRAAPPVEEDDVRIVRVDDLEIDPAARTAARAGEEVTLTRTEFDLLLLLARNVGHVLPRDLIFERVWGYPGETTSNTLDVYIGYLRRKTEVGDRPRLIHTVRGVGYVLRVPA